MESSYDFNPLDLAGIAADEQPSDKKLCPGLQQFCPHYNSEVCDVKYRECVLLNSLQTSEMMLRMEREHLLRDPTAKNLELVAQINDVLQDQTPDMHIDPAAILRSKRKGRFVAAVFFVLIFAAATLIYIS